MGIEIASFPEAPYTEDLFRHFRRKCPELFLVAKRSRRIAGYIITCTGGGKAELISIAVDPKHRGAGVGKALLAYTLDRLKESGITALALMVRSTSGDAISFYRAFGFRRTGKAPGYYEDGCDAVRMRLRL